MLCATGLLVGPAGAASTTTERGGGFDITWPSDSALADAKPGQDLHVSIRPRVKGLVATVSLSRITRSGRPLVIEKRRLRSGGFTATLPKRAGRYRLRLTSARGFAESNFELASDAGSTTDPDGPLPSCTFDQGYEAELAASTSVARPGDALTITLTNTGVTCLGVNFGLAWQVYRNGRWTDVSFGVVYPAMILGLAPGAKQEQTAIVPRNTPPGHYRAVKNFVDGDDVTIVISVRR